ncbi:nucleic acid-binding protein [Basidiobolus meristosporus CBS 931.73]|uniref:Nucleic acid-binding protein n=1 Tax=Basidiobolus meristosporus CBS 931.73 TaxID=1314790 RepID=A0A1Y1Y3R3_9FUNG|nr:nucleic acid-binding protein [Basidiobolus meristosporus CBS 931.73]|eukprot:ORX92525.1 nucleic acid-binding protein [Basidiobolus meristosporus CBS 931.73]
MFAAPFSTSSNTPGTKDAGGASEIPPENQEEEEHIHRLDLCVGKIVEAERHPSAEYLYIERVDVGDSPDPRIIVSGLVRYIPQEELIGRDVVVVRNMKPSKLRGIISHGMLLCASKDGKVELLEPPQGSMPGDRIFFDGFPGEADRILNPKKKIFEKVAPHFWTDENRICMYKNSPFKTKHGLVTVKSIVKGTIS